MKKIEKTLNYIYYAYKRNNYLFDITRFFRNYRNIKIENPIFLLGLEGGGLTFISRVIRRHPDVVSVSGNSTYWSGADEMQIVYQPILPDEFSMITKNIPINNYVNDSTLLIKSSVGWLYASNELINYYRKDKTDYSEELKEKFLKIIRWTISRNYKGNNTPVFIDKSQTYTLKMELLNEILKDYNPKFILITRNPYISCFRAPEKGGGLKTLKNRFSNLEMIKIASEHWSNSISEAFKSSFKVNNFQFWQFENILQEPEKSFRSIFNFCDLEFNKSYLPQENDKIPFGSRFMDRWYPINPEINDKYFKALKKEEINIVNENCGHLIEKCGYKKL